MASTRSCNMIYANQSTEEMGLIVADIGSIVADSNDEESELILSTTSYIKTWSLHGVQKSAPLKFKIPLCKANGEFIDNFDEREIKKWLCKNSFNWLSFDQDDMYDCNYFAILSNPQKVNIGRMSGGITVDCTCNANCAWTNLRIKNYTSTSTLTFNFINTMDFENYELCPTLTITSNSNQNISIVNNTTNKTVTINNCLKDEVIILDCENEMISTSSTRNIIDSWNIEFLNLVNNTNNITLTGNFTMKMEYRLPIRIGG